MRNLRPICMACHHLRKALSPLTGSVWLDPPRVPPKSLHNRLIAMDHSGHLDITTTNVIFRAYYWWPCMTSAADWFVRSYEACAHPEKSPLNAPCPPGETKSRRTQSTLHVFHLCASTRTTVRKRGLQACKTVATNEESRTSKPFNLKAEENIMLDICTLPGSLVKGGNTISVSAPLPINQTLYTCALMPLYAPTLAPHSDHAVQQNLLSIF